MTFHVNRIYNVCICHTQLIEFFLLSAALLTWRQSRRSAKATSGSLGKYSLKESFVQFSVVEGLQRVFHANPFVYVDPDPPLNWNDAEAHCASLSPPTHLASIHSQHENDI